ncbi:MAG: response regulator transcription factor [Rubrivivax sp.]|jgi:DNA-binding NarL/FixJ family response regulator|nr:response regulator transcription factor [Rubrivivax sp.]MBK8527830.1 response regulator transcription factor [Rubrivivax sp.]
MHDQHKPLNVLVVDDHDIVRLGVRQVLDRLSQPCNIREAASLREALDLLQQAPVDLMMLDLGLGDDFALGALPRLRAAAPAARILVLTSMPEDLYAERCLRAGADGFVVKSALSATLLDAVQTVLGGQIWVSVDQREALLRRATGRGGAVADRPELSARELDVLRLVAAGRSTREIAEHLNRSVKTVETHKQSLKLKLDAETPAMLVRKAIAFLGEGG